LSTILGSALLAALIGLGSSALTAHITNQGAERLEKYKQQLQAQNEQVKKRLTAYSGLSKNLDSLVSALDTYLRMVQIGARTPGDARAAAALRGQQYAVGLSQKGLLAAEKDPILRDSQLPAQINDCLARLNPVLARDLTGSNAASALSPVLEELKVLLSRVNGEMNKDLAS
jgi:hypothetical protein